ncbi:MAG: proprotein convertase P-domain-containing protein [Verrucomicrobiota bacterium]
MAAADASGTLALMQQFFEQGLAVTNSPAMMKALLINGARSAGGLYSFQVQNSINYQGWGLPKLNNTLPPGITNAISHSGEASMQLFDQSPSRALATGQSQTRSLAINEAGRNVPLRVTLVWTDPPGNPVAGVKLVNDLDLVVTNLTTGEVFFGNDIPVSSTFTFPWETNTPPNVDSINNVENVYLAPALGTNYSITVVGRRVNVNAVTAQTNNVVQDYALVISSGNGEVTNALALTEQPLTAVTVPYLTPVTNALAANTTVSGAILLGQHVGANTPLLGTTNGMTNQWHFYVVTNTLAYTNAAFITFLPPELAVPRMAVREDDAANGTLLDADIDLYVSTDPRLLSLDPAVIAAADQSRNRGGTEFVAYTNALPGAVYYVGVKSEDQMAAEYAFFGGFSLNPFSSTDENGNVIVNGFPVPNAIPDGTPAQPGGALTLGLALQPATIRELIVTNSIYHENMGDLLVTLSHARKFSVLSNHRSAVPGNYTYVYEDNDEVNLLHPDGPGKLRDFVGDSGLGVWLLTTVDNSSSQTGSITGFKLLISPTINSTNGESIFDVEPGRFVYNVVDVPVGATNLTVCLANLSLTPLPVELYLRRDGFPSRTSYEYFKVINPPADCLSVTPFDLPPLQPGRYYIGVYNPGGTAQKIRMKVTLGLDPNSVVPIGLNSVGFQPLRDDAVTDSIITVTNDALIQQVEVGLRINHPRVSDLAVTLISPRGTRVLLAQNRGGTSTEGFGSTISVTNVIPVSTNGGPSAVTNVIDTGATAGKLTIDYDFFDAPDQMTVYYQGAQLLDTGLTSGTGRLTVNYGPGLSTLVTIIMNESGKSEYQHALELHRQLHQQQLQLPVLHREHQSQHHSDQVCGAPIDGHAPWPAGEHQ